MNAVDLARRRRLTRICDRDGLIRAAAIDHPETYAILFDEDLSKVTHAEVVQSKLELIAAMAPFCTALLLDPETAWGPAVDAGIVPGAVGTISGLEKLYYQPGTADFEPRLEIRPGWEPEGLVTFGVDAAKLVVFHRAGSPESARLVEQVGELADRCHRAGLPLVVEPLWFWRPGEDPQGERELAARTESVLESTRLFKAAGADIMKVEFPVDLVRQTAAADSACVELNSAAAGPWVLLSAGVTFEGFCSQLELASAAGASGFMAGRAIWGDAVGRLGENERRQGARLAVERLEQLSAVVRRNPNPAYPMRDDAEIGSGLAPDWYLAGER